jgi:hypothetical protein
MNKEHDPVDPAVEFGDDAAYEATLLENDDAEIERRERRAERVEQAWMAHGF